MKIVEHKPGNPEWLLGAIVAQLPPVRRGRRNSNIPTAFVADVDEICNKLSEAPVGAGLELGEGKKVHWEALGIKGKNSQPDLNATVYAFKTVLESRGYLYSRKTGTGTLALRVVNGKREERPGYLSPKLVDGVIRIEKRK